MDLGYCYNRNDHVFVWSNLDFGALGYEIIGMHCLMDHTSKSREDNGAKSYFNFQGLTQDVSENIIRLPTDSS